jgi:adenylate cyclase
LGAEVRGRLPARVERIIAAREVEAERLIGWAQLVIGLTWTALYIASPKTFEADETFAPVPVALGLYLAFTCLRLMLVYRGFTPAWFLGLSVFFDMALLLGLIWSFHLQYGQPAAFYLKAPTLLYVFIFIALRALRFSARYVLLAGTLAALGWFGLLHYALLTSEAPNMGVTRDYVSYMTSSMILLGAEFDKIIAILLSTAILAIAILRARRLLVASVVEGAAHRDLSRFFAPEIADQITRSEDRIQPGEGEVRDAAILICDVRGFTQIAMTMAPNALMALLADYEARMVAVIQRHGGSIDKFLGDGVMATFGAAAPTKSYAADALRAIHDLAATAEAWADERRAGGEIALKIGFAAAAGRVVFGAVGDPSRLEFTVIGEPVNLAAKIEKQNKVEAVTALTTAETLRLAEAQGFEPPATLEHRPARDVEGLEAPVDLVVLAP